MDTMNNPYRQAHEDFEDDWRPLASCRNHPPDTFFPTAKGNGSTAQAARAAAICIDCPVFIQCRDYANHRAEKWGVWAGVDYGSPEVRRGKPINPTRVPVLRCGTEAGAARHRRRGETVCAPCRDGEAMAKQWRARRQTV